MFWWDFYSNYEWPQEQKGHKSRDLTTKTHVIAIDEEEFGDKFLLEVLPSPPSSSKEVITNTKWLVLEFLKELINLANLEILLRKRLTIKKSIIFTQKSDKEKSKKANSIFKEEFIPMIW